MSDTFGQAASDLAVSRLSPFQAAAGSDAASLVDTVGAELDLAASRLRGTFRCIKDYGSLSTADQATFDTAVGLAAAITLLMPTAAVAAGGVSQLKADVDQFTFLLPPEEEQVRWGQEITAAVSRLSCVQNARVSVAQNLNVMYVNGRTRIREQKGRFTLARMLAGILPAGWGGDRRSWTYVPGTEGPNP